MPDLKDEYTERSEIPTGFEKIYSEDNDGKFKMVIATQIFTQQDRDELHSNVVKERNLHKETKAKLKPWDGMDVEETRTQLDRIPELETLAEGNVDETKLNELAEARTLAKLAPVQRELDQEKVKLTELVTENTDLKSGNTRRSIRDALLTVATESKVLPTAIEDIMLLGENVFEVSEEGKVLTRSEVNNVTPGLDPSVWLGMMVDKRPHWWPMSEGGGAGGGTINKFPHNPWTKQYWNMTDQGKIVRENRNKADQMAKAAGSNVGATKPTEK